MKTTHPTLRGNDACAQALDEALGVLRSGSKAGQLRRLLPLIERKRAEGVSQHAILQALNRAGLVLSLSTFKSYLYRERRRAIGKVAAGQKTMGAVLPRPAAMPDAVASGTATSSPSARPQAFEFDPNGLAPDLLK